MIARKNFISGVKHHQLQNGMRIYSRSLHNFLDLGYNGNLVSSFYQRAAFPKLNFILSISSGSALDTSDNRGLHHLFEHCFIATKDMPSFSEVREMFEERKGWVNAFTNFEALSVVGAMEDTPDNFQEVMKYLGCIMSNPYFDQSVLEREKNRVLVEFMEYEDDIEKRLRMKNYSSIASYNDIAINTLGNEDHVLNTSVDDLASLHKKICVGENLSLTITTRTPPFLVAQSAEKYFSALPQGEKASVDSLVYKYGSINNIDDGQVKSSNFDIVFHAGNLIGEERAQLVVASILLNAYFYESVIKSGKAYHCEAHANFLDYAEGSITFTGKVAGENIESIFSGIHDAFSRFDNKISPYRYNEAVKSLLRMNSNNVEAPHIAFQMEKTGEYIPYRIIAEDIKEALKFPNIVSFIKDRVLVNPPSIAINGGNGNQISAEYVGSLLKDLHGMFTNIEARDIPNNNKSSKFVDSLSRWVPGL